MLAHQPLCSVGDFLRAEPARLRDWVNQRTSHLVMFCLVVIVLGAGLYGAVMGSWSNPRQVLYSGIKLPLVILLTTLGNGLINGMLAPLLGLNLTFRQSLAAVLVSFAIASLILASLSPVAWFIIMNTTPLSATTRVTSPEYGFMQLCLAVFVAIAGITGNIRLLPLLAEWTRTLTAARNVLFAWLAINLFLGSQICWVLRPFIWEPTGKTMFIGPQYLHGSFYETVFEALRRLFL